MSETALLSSYKKNDDTDIDNWLTQYAGKAQQAKPAQPATAEPTKAPEPVKPGGFFSSVGSSLGKAAGAVKTRFTEGVQQVGEAVTGKTQEGDFQPMDLELPGVGKVNVPGPVVRAAHGAMGALGVAFPFSAAAGSIGTDVAAPAIKSGLTDEAIKARIAKINEGGVLTKIPTIPGVWQSEEESKKHLEQLLLMPYDERVKKLSENVGLAAEIAASIVPGYTGAMKLGGKLAGAAMAPAKAAGEAAHAARIEAMRAAGERFATEHAAQQTAQQAEAAARPAQAGAPKPPMTLADLKQGMQPDVTPGVKTGTGASGQAIPENVMTLDKLHAKQRLSMLQSDPAAREAMDSIPEASSLVQEPGLQRRQGMTTREQLREQNVTPLDTAPRQLHPYAPTETMDAESTRIAREYDAAITDPKSKPAWDALASDTERMFGEINKKLKIEKVTGQPYASAEEMVADMKKGNFKVTTDNSQHPFWTEEQNWKFRVVHDYLGHFETGADFSLAGEKKAFLAHAAQLTNEDAKKALQSEVVGQAASYTANAGKFPEQKAFIPKEKVSAVASEHAAEIATATNEGGASFSMADGRLRGMEEGGYYVSIAQERQVTISGREVSPEDISRFAEKNADLLAQPGAHIGSERLPDGMVNLDISVRTENEAEAMRLGQQHGQERIWDATNGKSIDVPQAGATAAATAPVAQSPVKATAYHGTSTAFDEYKGSAFFAEKPETANYYANRQMLDSGAPAGDAPQIRPVSLSLQHPASEQMFREALDLMQNDKGMAEELLKSKGYDGVRFEGADTGKGVHYLAFDPNKQAMPLYGEAGKPLETAVEAAKRRISERFKEITGTGEEGSVQLRGSFTEGWEKNRQLINDLGTVGASYLWEGTRSFKEWSARMVSEFGEQIVPQLKVIFEKAQAQIGSLVREGISTKLTSSKVMLEKAKAGEFAGGWYDDAKAEFDRMFGANADLFSDLIAATSPNQSVSGNITRSLSSMEMIMTGERHAGKPFTMADGFMPAHLQNLNRILRDQPLSGPKVDAFARAIKGDRDAVVVDTWMFRAFGMADMTTKTEPTPARVKFIQQAVSDIARELGMDNRQAQAAIWSAQKIESEGAQDIKPLAEMVKDALTSKGLLDREWVFPKTLEEKLPSWVTEEGKVRLGTLFVLGRAAVGAVIGGMVGDDPESHVRNALLAAGLGAVLSPKLARTIAENIAKPEIREALREAATLKGEAGALRFPKRAVGENPSPNTARMGASTEAKQLVRGINEKLAEAGRLDRTTTKTFEQTRAEAAKSPFNTVEGVLGMDTAKLTLDELDGAITAARDVRDASLERVLQSASQAKLANDPELAKQVVDEFLLSGRISEQVTNAQTAYGRGLGAQRMQSDAARAATKYNLDTLDTEMQAMRQALLERGKVSDLQLVEMLTTLGDKAAAAKLAEVGSKYPSALWNIYYGLNLLGSPLTQFRNVLGNMGGLSMAVADRAFGEIIAAPFHAFGKGDNLVQLGETYELAKGLWQVVGDTFRSAKDAKAVPGGMRSAFLDTYRSGESSFMQGGSKASEMLRTIELAKETGNGSLPVLIQAMSTLAEKNMRVMGGVDEVFKTLTFHGELRALALREAKGTGMEGKALATEIERLVESPSKDMLAMAEAAAHENTFTKAFNANSEGWGNIWGLGGKMEKVAQNPAMRLLVSPFYRTPSRIAEFSTVHTPGLNLLAVQFYSDLAAGGAKANMAWAKLATGSAIIGLVGFYAAHGYITGDWPDDPGLKAAYERAGWKPKSIYVPFIGKYVSYDNFEPLSTLLGTTANVIQIGRDLPEWHADTLMMAGAIAAGKSSISKQWFQGVSDIVDVIEGLRQGDSADMGVKWLENRLVSLTPGAAVGRLVANMTDQERRDYKSVSDKEHPEMREFETLTNRFKAVVPGWSKTRPAIPNMITGEPLPNENSWLGALSPWQFSTLKNDKVLNELVALDGAGLPKELPRAIGGSQGASPFKFPGDEQRMVREGIKLSDPERARLGTILTKEIEDNDGNTLHTALGELMDSEEYKDASDGRYGGKSTLVAQTFNAFMDQAQAQLRDEYPKLDQSVIRRKLERDLGKLPKSQEDQKPDIMESVLGAR